LRIPPPDGRARLDRMPGSTVPVIRQPFAAGDPLPYWARGRFSGNLLFDVADDPGEERNLAGTKGEKEAADLLREALTGIGARVAAAFYRATASQAMGIRRRRQFLVEGRQILGISDDELARPEADGGGAADGADGPIRAPEVLAMELEKARTGEMRDIVATIQ